MTRWPLTQAHEVAEDLLARLAPSCERIAIAGSIRRRRADVKDIELVAVPGMAQRPGDDLWGTPYVADLLLQEITILIARGLLAAREVEAHRADGTVDVGQKMGDAYLALVFRDIPVDLFVVRPPAEWGVIFALRTGPGDWNTRLVTDCHRFLRRVSGGQVFRAGQAVACPEEADFFDAVGQPWVEPEERAPNRVRIMAQVPA